MTGFIYWLCSNGVVYLWRGGELAAFTNAIKGGHPVVFAVDINRVPHHKITTATIYFIPQLWSKLSRTGGVLCLHATADKLYCGGAKGVIKLLDSRTLAVLAAFSTAPPFSR